MPLALVPTRCSWRSLAWNVTLTGFAGASLRPSSLVRFRRGCRLTRSAWQGLAAGMPLPPAPAALPEQPETRA